MNGPGCEAWGNRIEISRRAHVLGMGSNFRFIIGSSDNASGGTRITVGCTAGLAPNGAIPGPPRLAIQDYWGWSDPNYNLGGYYALGTDCVIVNSSQIDLLHVPFKPIPPGFTPVLADGGLGIGVAQGATVSGGSSEGNGVWVWVEQATCAVIEAMYCQLHSTDPGGGAAWESAAAIIIKGGMSASTIKAIGGGGQGQLGFIYQVPGGPSLGLEVGQISGFSGIAVQGTYPNGSTTFKMAPYLFMDKLFPDWLNGSTVQSINTGASVPPGTKVVSVNPSANTFTLSNGISGSLSDGGSPYRYPWFQFVGQGGVYLR
jgi:hypothetical protein